MVRLTDRPDMTLDVYCGRKTVQQCNNNQEIVKFSVSEIVKFSVSSA